MSRPALIALTLIAVAFGTNAANAAGYQVSTYERSTIVESGYAPSSYEVQTYRPRVVRHYRARYTNVVYPAQRRATPPCE
jgi:hypothetical protein